jgi:hypothetical protein
MVLESVGEGENLVRVRFRVTAMYVVRPSVRMSPAARQKD